jgi:hypothetical protein
MKHAPAAFGFNIVLGEADPPFALIRDFADEKKSSSFRSVISA